MTKDEWDEIVDEYVNANYSNEKNIANNLYVSKNATAQAIAYEYLKKHYTDFLHNSITINIKTKTPSNKVWVCWLQGMENAPKPIQVCYEALKKNLLGNDIILITEQNIGKYIEFPSHIVDNRNKGIISNVHFSDLLRLELLIRHGGIWIDADVLCTGNKCIDDVSKIPLFVLKNPPEYKNIYTSLASSWFIAAWRNSVILTATRDLLYKYWADMDYIINYFIIHLFFRMAAEYFADEWKSIPEAINRLNPRVLREEKFDPYSKARFEELKQISDFHKLSYKQKYTNAHWMQVLAGAEIMPDSDKKDTLWDMIVNHGVQ